MSYDLTNFHPKATPVAKHIGLIPDGARRWAKRENVSLPDAYLHSMQKLTQHIEFFFNEGIQAISIYLSSIYNFKRSDVEVTAFCEAETTLCNKTLPNLAKRFGTRIIVAGKVEILPLYLRKALEEIDKLTSSQSQTRLYLCAAYNPLDEIVNAFRLADNPDDFIRRLWVPEPLDLVIRTSGESTLSNFLPLQAGYARLYFIDKLFNDTEVVDFQMALTKFKGLIRHYGD